MAVGLSATLPEIHPVAGVWLGTTAAGIKKHGQPDLVVMRLSEQTRTAAVFTRNAFCAAPVTVAKAHLAVATPRALVINAGNANAGTGEQGLEDARTTCAWVAAELGVEPEQVLPFSTGVIGEYLPMAAIEQGIPAALAGLSVEGWHSACYGIMTTDTVPKVVSRRVDIDGSEIVITGMAKGSGMIHPNMATMLAFVATDAKVAQPVLAAVLQQAVDASFNRITVDGDTSTNDACTLSATAEADMAEIGQLDSPAGQAFASAITQVLGELAQMIVRDGEGATKFVTIRVEEAASQDDALKVAFTIAHSPLVKTALFASDPNWGRILAAVGRAGVAGLNIQAVRIWLDDVCIVKAGGRSPDYTEADGQRVMRQDE
ncbi:MAG TPA: bifunctional glutamate N-acetyltransferase/amino-acid acetyltransferase ArgJ, partial [Sulfurivirga caldicuralii]|nr:bifunctional glutamate N-acetyltransferase/amino-acid acetyltransferase ArgJ [Sulfurivirga caldicuralii]